MSSSPESPEQVGDLHLLRDARPARDAVVERFPTLRVFVVGDAMLDKYLIGACERISPEAPVQVVRLERQKSSLGGAANVASNLAALHVGVDLICQVGEDVAADEIVRECAAQGIGTACIVHDASDRTIVKTRVLAGDRQLLRIDEEDASPCREDQSERLLAAIRTRAASAKPDAVIISDYAKGLCTPYFCRRLISDMNDIGVPVYVDPKGRDYSKYRGARAIKPNRVEMMELAKVNGWPTGDLIECARLLIAQLKLAFVALTLGADGIALVTEETVRHFPTVAKEVFDVSGAGDTVIATMVAGLAAGLDQAEAVTLANVAAAEVVSHVGSRPIYRDELLVAIQSHSRGLRGRKRYETDDLASIVKLWKRQGQVVGFTNGCFDLLHAGHVHLLEDAAAKVDRLIVGVNSDESVRRLKGPLRPLMTEAHRVTVLSALEAVDAVVVFDADTPLEVIETILPDVLIKGGDYTRDTVVGADVVERNGGRVELIPLVPGVSTSYLAAAIERL